MPKRVLVAAPRRKTDRDLEDLLHELGGTSTGLAMRILKLFPAYLHSCGRDPSQELALAAELEVRRRFICFLLSGEYLDAENPIAKKTRAQGPGELRARTVLGYLKTMRQFGIRPGHLEEAEARISDHVFLKGLTRLSARDEPLRVKEYPSPREMLQLCFGAVREASPDRQRREVHLRCFWYILIVTGARPGNLLICPFYISPDGIWVGWRWRKGGRVQLRGETLYRFSWTTPPPRELHEPLLELSRGWRERPHAGPWYFQDCTSAATVVNNWLHRRRKNPPARWTSTTPRSVLSSLLLARVHQGTLSELNFVWLMDHTVQTARGHYAQSSSAAGLEAESSDDEVEKILQMRPG